MTITTVATQVPPGTPEEVARRLGPALAVAEGLGAWLTALVYSLEGETAQDGAAAEAAGALLARRGLRGEVRARSSFAYGAGEVFVDQLRVSDLAVLPLDLTQGAAPRLMLHSAVFGCGRPVLVVPPCPGLARMPRRVLVGWDASPAAVRAVTGALPFLRLAEETVVATVGDHGEFRPGNSGVELTHLLARHGVTARFSALPDAAGGTMAALAAAGQAEGAEMMVVGAVRHAPLRDILFGGVTDELFQGRAGMPCLMAA